MSRGSRQISAHTTVAIERTTLRLIGVDGIDEEDVPLPNRVVDGALRLLPGGILRPFVATMLRNDLDVQATAEAIGRGELALHEVGNERELLAATEAEAMRLVGEGIVRIRAGRAERAAMVEELGNPPAPWLYVIVAMGNIYEDIIQAQAAARQGADVIAVIRSTAQSLLDYVPYGPTTEGFGGTHATQANFKLMRAALDLAVNAKAMSLLSDLNKICFIGTNKRVLVCHSRYLNWISNSVLKIMLA